MSINARTFTAELKLGRTDEPNRELFRFWSNVTSRDRATAYKYLSGDDYDSVITYIRDAIIKANTNLQLATPRITEQIGIKHYKYLDKLMDRVKYIVYVIAQCEIYIIWLEFCRERGEKFNRNLLMRLSIATIDNLEDNNYDL